MILLLLLLFGLFPTVNPTFLASANDSEDNLKSKSDFKGSLASLLKMLTLYP